MSGLPPIRFSPELRDASVREQAMAILELFEDKRRHNKVHLVDNVFMPKKCCVLGAACLVNGKPPTTMSGGYSTRIGAALMDVSENVSLWPINDSQDGWHRIQDLLIRVIVRETEADR